MNGIITVRDGEYMPHLGKGTLCLKYPSGDIFIKGNYTWDKIELDTAGTNCDLTPDQCAGITANTDLSATNRVVDMNAFAIHRNDKHLHLTSAQNAALDAANDLSASNPVATMNDMAGGFDPSLDQTITGNWQFDKNIILNSQQLYFKSDDSTKNQFIQGIGTNGTSHWSMGRLTNGSDKVTIWNNTTPTGGWLGLHPDGVAELAHKVVIVNSDVGGSRNMLVVDATDTSAVNNAGIKFAEGGDEKWSLYKSSGNDLKLRSIKDVDHGGQEVDEVVFYRDPALGPLFTKVPRTSVTPTNGEDLTNKDYVDSAIAASPPSSEQPPHESIPTIEMDIAGMYPSKIQCQGAFDEGGLNGEVNGLFIIVDTFGGIRPNYLIHYYAANGEYYVSIMTKAK